MLDEEPAFATPLATPLTAPVVIANPAFVTPFAVPPATLPAKQQRLQQQQMNVPNPMRNKSTPAPMAIHTPVDILLIAPLGVSQKPSMQTVPSWQEAIVAFTLHGILVVFVFVGDDERMQIPDVAPVNAMRNAMASENRANRVKTKDTNSLLR